MTKTDITLAQLRANVGKSAGQSPWRLVTQDMINAFGDATDDHQWIHMDQARAKAETPFGGTIAHGFLTLSLLSTFAFETLPNIATTEMGMNYGFDKIRFVSPVASGASVRAVFDLAGAEIRPSGRVLTYYDVTLEIEGSKKPAFTARWITLSVIDPNSVDETGKFGAF